MSLKKFALFSLGLAAAVSAWAQAQIGTVSSVTGVVSATQGATAVNVGLGTPIASGTRFIAASGSSVTLTLANGCTVNVPANHGVTVIQGMTCPQLVAAVQPVVPVGAAALASTQGIPAAVLVMGGLGLAAVAFSQGSDSKDPPLSAR